MRLRATRLSAISNALRSVFKIASVNPVLWWDAESHRAGLAGGAATLFQDSAGTSPVTAVEQPVGRAIDQSGNARHALQATSTARPLLTARKNLLGFSEQFDNVAWARSNCSVVANASLAPDGTMTADKLVEDTVNTQHTIRQPISTPSVLCTFSVYLKAGERQHARIFAFAFAPNDFSYVPSAYINLSTGAVTNSAGCTVSVVSAGGGWWRVRVSTTTIFPSKPQVAFFVAPCSAPTADSYAGDGVSGIFVWGAQLELGSSATAYQRITTASDYDITAAPLMLRFDGVDDELATATFASGTLPANADVYVVLSRAEGDGNTVPIYGQDTNRYVGAWDSPASALYSFGAGAPTYLINGGAAPGSITLPSESTYICEARNANLSAWTVLKIGKYGASWNFSGRIGAVLITRAQSDSTRAKIRKALAKAYQIQGVV